MHLVQKLQRETSGAQPASSQDWTIAISLHREVPVDPPGRPRMVRSPVEICRGTNPSQAAKSRPLENTSPVPIAATMALEMTGPMPGTVIRRAHAGSFSTKLVMSADKPSMRSSSRR